MLFFPGLSFDALLSFPPFAAALQGLPILILVFALCRLLPSLPARIRCGLWWLVCFKSLLGLLWIPAVPLPVLPSSPTGPSAIRRLTTPAIPPAPLPTSAKTAQARTPPVPLASVPLSVTASRALACFASLVYHGGVLFFGGLAVYHVARLRRLTVRALPLIDDVITEECAALAKALGLRQAPRLFVTPETTAPVVLLDISLRPLMILHQTDISSLAPEERRAVLAHELAHIRRGDLLLGMAPVLARTFFWFFPPIYLACWEYESTREVACDREARLAAGLNPSDYGRLLMKLGAISGGPPTGAAALSVTSHFRMLERRLLMLNQSESRRLLRGGVALIAALTLTVVIPWRLVAASPPISPAVGPVNLTFESGTKGWSLAGKTDALAAHIDPSTKTPSGRPTVLIESTRAVGNPPHYTDEDGRMLHQSFDATPYIGKTIRFRALLKSDLGPLSVTGIALRVDGNNEYQKAWNRHILTWRPQPMGWTPMEYVLVVPPKATEIDLMIGLLGNGKVWAGDVTFEVLPPGDRATPTAPDTDSDTNEDNSRHGPRNLDFRDGLSGWGSSANGTNGPANPYYVVGVDPSVRRNDKPSGFLMASVENPIGYGALRQDIDADAFRGKRIRYRGFFRAQGVNDQADTVTPLLTIDSGNASRVWILKENPLRGDSDWQQLELVADVPADSTTISFGASIHGRGKILVNDLTLETVGKDVSLSPGPSQTAVMEEPDLPRSPLNTDFSAGLEGWGKANPEGSAPDYAIGLDKKGGRSGGPAAFLTATADRPRSYGTLLNYFVPLGYRGKRIRYSAYLRTENAQAAGLWLRVDRRKIGEGGGGWNMTDHPIQGTTGWTKYECVLDIPADAAGINFGIDLTGKGKVWVDGFHFEIVGRDIPTTPGAL